MVRERATFATVPQRQTNRALSFPLRKEQRALPKGRKPGDEAGSTTTLENELPFFSEGDITMHKQNIIGSKSTVRR